VALSHKNPIRKLIGHTAVYGLGTILGRIFNYLLTPLYTGIFSEETFGEYAVAYAYIAILLVLLTYGMETALFHFATRTKDKALAFSTAMISILVTTSLFWVFIFAYQFDIAVWLRQPDKTQFVIWLGLIIGLDALTALPMAWLRLAERPYRFTLITLSNIGVNIGLNLFFLVYCRQEFISSGGQPNALVKWIYNPDIGVGYIFIANLAASLVKAVACMPIMAHIRPRFDVKLWLQMARYAFPLLLAGLGFIINERLDVLLLEYLLPLDPELTRHEIGVYSACYKLAILMTIFIQAYRYAAEPFFFSLTQASDARRVYAKVMNFFTAFCAFIFLWVCLYLDIFKYFLRGEGYWEGLSVVPVLMLGNLFLGIYINLSMWYKLSGQTWYGAVFSVIGAALTIGLNVALIPHFGYHGSAWTTFFAYGAMMVISYLTGQKHYPIPYQVPKNLFYIGLAVALYAVSLWLPNQLLWWVLLVRTALLFPFLYVVWVLEPDLRHALLRLKNKRWRK
jgi:O-antigen/teichoic acid export membrane protein